MMMVVMMTPAAAPTMVAVPMMMAVPVMAMMVPPVDLGRCLPGLGLNRSSSAGITQRQRSCLLGRSRE
jgi:hypothetical protein